MTVAFVSHGAPTLALDPEKGAALRSWGTNLGRPNAVLVVSAHWEQTPPAVGTTEPRPLLYDFYGFPDELYQLRYPAPAAAELAPQVLARLDGFGPRAQQDRPWDHGVWVPLMHLFPKADVAVLQLSLPSRESPQRLFDLGKALAPLVAEGILLLGSGSTTHNLRHLRPDGTSPFAWAEAFDAWAAETVQQRDWEALVSFRTRAPNLMLAHPSDEHFLPLLVSAGAASVLGGEVRFPVEGFEYGSLSRRCFQWG
jgi:4,5-DOPA dioxygenase extradiol